MDKFTNNDWQELTRLTGGRPFVVERVRLLDPDIAIEGRFEPPQLAHLGADDQVFVAAFLRSHGSIKDMEALFGVSYPTIKARLNRIAERLPLMEPAPPAASSPSRADVLDRLDRGEIDATQAARELGQSR